METKKIQNKPELKEYPRIPKKIVAKQPNPHTPGALSGKVMSSESDCSYVASKSKNCRETGPDKGKARDGDKNGDVDRNNYKGIQTDRYIYRDHDRDIAPPQKKFRKD
jgi:hypothetical protein